ncbi:MAG TPA: hypothetical protein VEA58_04385 [Anaerovoracaceae bacterium]|nr:hypothetical protein [Anaerovoracaceae bacterium]
MSDNLMVFKNKSEIALNAMEEHAKRIGASGVAVFLYSENENAKDLSSIMRIVGAINTIAEDHTGYNFIALAYSKIAESIETGKNSGNLTRPMIEGEFGYQGSAIAKDENGIIITAFSGCTGDVDLEIAKTGLQSLLVMN